VIDLQEARLTSIEITTKKVTDPIRSMAAFFASIKRDIDSVLERDPAARSRLEVFWFTQVCMPSGSSHHPLMAMMYVSLHGSRSGRWVTGEIHPGARLRWILSTTEWEWSSRDCRNQGRRDHLPRYTLKALKGKRHPTIGDRVVIGAGAKILGAIEVGADSRIGANAVVVKSVPTNSVVVGVPGQIVRRSHLHTAGDAPDLNHTSLPDIIGVTLKELLQRVEHLETRANGHEVESPHHIHAPADEAWDGHDFMI
jgi:serine O-acetyltransferase